MTTGVIEPETARRGGIALPRRESAALLGILALAAVLYCWSLGDRTLQPYYAAALHAMSRGAKAFLFAGYDPTGLVSADKPPMAFWVQSVGVWIFGYHWWAIALVQAIEGVAAVFVLHRVVRRWAGEHTALLAALFLAISPVGAAIYRENQPDGLLVLLLLLAAYCVTRAVEHTTEPAGARTGLGWLLGAGILVGLGFTTKMLAAWVVLPALALAYLAARSSWPRRIGRLLVAGAVTLVVSLAWPVLVALWPAGDRPYIGSTTDNSIWQLIFGYNGFGRVSGGPMGSLGGLANSFGAVSSGTVGPLRLFGPDVAGQIGWLLPVALAGVLVAAGVWLRTRGGTPRQRAGWLLWGGWLIVVGVVFSFAGGIFHAYYTVELAPAVAALAAMGLTVCWRWYRPRVGGVPGGDGSAWPAGLLLPAAVAGTAGYAYLVLAGTPDWLPWLRLVIAVLGVLSAVALVVLLPGFGVRARTGPVLLPVFLVGLLAMITGPAAYAIDTAGRHADAWYAANPTAGPSTTDFAATHQAVLGDASRVLNAYLSYLNDSLDLGVAQREVLDYATAHAPAARIPLAVEGGSYGADPFLVNTDAPVAALGGYIGLDAAPGPTGLATLVRTGQLRFVLLPAVFLVVARAATGQAANPQLDRNAISDRLAWVRQHCAVVPPQRIGPAAQRAGLLFDCGVSPTGRP